MEANGQRDQCVISVATKTKKKKKKESTPLEVMSKKEPWLDDYSIQYCEQDFNDSALMA